ncbi:MAG: zinc ABC transporter substrate-binding protein [Candidatus Caldatribacteriota bacterium]
MAFGFNRRIREKGKKGEELVRMRVRWRVVIIFLIIAVFFSDLNIKTTGMTKENEKEEKLKILVSIPPYAYLVEQVGKDRVEVKVMVPANADPHTYDPTPNQLKMISESQLFILVGSGIDFEMNWSEKIKKLNPKMRWYDSSTGIAILENNPHIWLSLRNTQKIVENITASLIQIDPLYQDFYQQNAKYFKEKLIYLDEQLIHQLKSLKERKFLTYHPSWVYLARDYQLEQLTIEQEGKEPHPTALMELINKAKKYQLSFILGAPQFNLKSAEVIAREVGAQIVIINPLERNYLENFTRIADLLSGKGL